MTNASKGSSAINIAISLISIVIIIAMIIILILNQYRQRQQINYQLSTLVNQINDTQQYHFRLTKKQGIEIDENEKDITALNDRLNSPDVKEITIGSRFKISPRNDWLYINEPAGQFYGGVAMNNLYTKGQALINNVFFTDNYYGDEASETHPTGAEISQISNDVTKYKELVLVGNKSSGERKVGVADVLDIHGGKLCLKETCLDEIELRKLKEMLA